MFTKIARDGVCVITNHVEPDREPVPADGRRASSPARSATGAKCPGAQVSGPIDLFDRDGASGTQDAFQHIFLGENLKISPSATPENSDGLEESAVAGDKQAIGFVSFDFIDGNEHRRLPGHPVHAAQRQVGPVPRRA